MTIKHVFGCLVCIVAAGVADAADDAARSAAKFFESEVRPVLANRCFKCHNDKKQSGGLRLDNIGYIKAGGDSGPALEPGNSDDSLLIQAIRYDGFEMPPDGKLPEREIAILERWVKEGAYWPEKEVTRVDVDEFGFTAEDRKFWSFQPLTNPQPPQVASSWVRNDIDRFVAAKHQELGLTPAAEADRHELVRRLYFTLHGLPPTQEQIDDFVEDRSPDAYERLIDALLASPRYGER